MSSERLYSTRELSQLWNVSETTIKRWTLSKGLNCLKTPGGHRRFSLNDIIEFQGRRGFEASGLLQGGDSDFSDLEIWINTKNFLEIRKFIFILAMHNRVNEIKEFLNRLYLRGVSLADLYDEVLIDLAETGAGGNPDIDLDGYRLNLVRSNLRTAVHFFFLCLESGKKNGRTALCVSPVPNTGIPLQLMSCVFKEQGWECLTLREPCDLEMMNECVKKEPVNLLSIWVPCEYEADPVNEQRAQLVKFLRRYRIPVVVVQRKPHSKVLQKYYSEKSIGTFHQFQKYVKFLN
jgi:MerR family transcriptional regulator, light-induced transcriptional regulator